MPIRGCGGNPGPKMVRRSGVGRTPLHFLNLIWSNFFAAPPTLDSSRKRYVENPKSHRFSD